jgi:parallel beta-helix repeat protein
MPSAATRIANACQRLALWALVAGAVVALLVAAALIAPARGEAAVRGDADCSGVIDSIDAVRVLQFDARLVNSLPCQSSGDVNNDSQINSLDAVFLLQYVAGLINTFPTCNASPAPPNAQAAIDSAGNGSTVCLAPGQYNRLFLYRKNGVTIYGSGSSSTTITDDPNNDFCILIIESSNVTVRGLKVSNCADQGVYVGQSSNVKLEQVVATGSPIGIDYQNSSGRMTNVSGNNNADFGALVQTNANVTIDGGSNFSNNGFGILAQDNSTLIVRDSTVSNNPDGGIFTIKQTGSTTIERTAISGGPLGVFVGVPGCAGLPAGDPNPPQCYVDNPDAYRSSISFRMTASTVSNPAGTGVVIFPGVSAVLQSSTISGADMTGLFAWGATVDAAGNTYDGNVENAVECRAYPAPSTGSRGMCRFTYETFRGSLPLGQNSLGGGFVSEGGAFAINLSLIENNWGIGVQVLHNGTGSVTNTTIRNNGGTAFCISGAGAVTLSGNSESGNRPGTCLGHP